MNFGDELAEGGLIELRGHAESRMRATCEIERWAGETTVGGVATDTYAPIYPAPEWPDDHPHADGKCRMTDFNAHPSTPEVAGANVVVNQPRVLIPTGAPKVIPGDRVRILTDPDNPVVPGTVLHVAGVRGKSQEIQRHLICDDLQTGQLA